MNIEDSAKMFEFVPTCTQSVFIYEGAFSGVNSLMPVIFISNMESEPVEILLNLILINKIKFNC